MQIITQIGGGFEKERSKLTNEQLDRPIDEVVAAPSAESVPEQAIETVPEAAPAEEEKVPKSRFLTMHQRAVEAEKALRQFEAERETTPEPVKPIADDADLKKFYTSTFGETEIAEKLYQAELARLTAIEERVERRAYERLGEREQVEARTIEARVSSMDSAFEELSVVTGKDFSDDEQVALLDIVEKYSPKDRNGKIPEEYLMSLDDAYEIFQMQSEASKPNRSQRNAVAALSGARSEGASSIASDADWKPGQRGRYESKLNK